MAMPAAIAVADGASSPTSRASAETASQTTSSIASKDATTSVTRRSMRCSFHRADPLHHEVAQPDVEAGHDQAHQGERRPDPGETQKPDSLAASLGYANRH